jgi:hypothetical protein
MQKRSLLVDLKVGQSIKLDNGRISITLEDKSGKLARLRVVAESDVMIQRPGALQSRFRSGAKQALMGVKLKIAA